MHARACANQTTSCKDGSSDQIIEVIELWRCFQSLVVRG